MAHCARKVTGAAIQATALTVLDGAPCITVCPECAGVLIIHVRGIHPERCARCAALRRKRKGAQRRDEQRRARAMTAALSLLLILPLLAELAR